VTGSGDHEDVDAPLRLQPVVARPEGWRGRSATLIGGGLVVFLVIALVLGRTFDEGPPPIDAPIAGASMPGTATAHPTVRATARPTRTRAPLPTPLPAHMVAGSDLPTERRLVLADGLELLDLASGQLSPLARALGYDAVLLPGDEIACACVVFDGGDQSKPSIRFGRYEQTGTPIVERDVLSLDGVQPVVNATSGFTVGSAVDNAAGRLFVLVTERRPPVYLVELLVLDVETGDTISTIPIDEIPDDVDEAAPAASPSPSRRPDGNPPDGTFIWNSRIALSPSGQAAFLQLGIENVRRGVWTNSALEWLVDVGRGGQASVRALPDDALLAPNAWCPDKPTFVDDELVVQACTRMDEGVPSGMAVRRIERDGTSRGDIAIETPESYGAFTTAVTVDPERRAIYLWQFQDHVLERVDVDSGGVLEVRVPASMLPAGGPAPNRLSIGIGGATAAVLSDDGRRLYAIGMRGLMSGPGRPSGIWVFDTARLELIDHWEPRAFLASLSLSADERFVYAAGGPGYDSTGAQNPWPASVVVHDARTGEVVEIYGALADGTWITFPPLP
jgi:hypothetical protein